MQLHEKTLKAQKRGLGDKHPHTLDSMKNLALSFDELGQYQEAMQLEEKTLKATKEYIR